jgi:hypothetical protein
MKTAVRQKVGCGTRLYSANEQQKIQCLKQYSKNICNEIYMLLKLKTFICKIQNNCCIYEAGIQLTGVDIYYLVIAIG